MITPGDKIPLDDTDAEDADDQQSQKDIHSNGLDEENEATYEDSEGDVDRLTQASAAADPSYLLDDDSEEDD